MYANATMYDLILMYKFIYIEDLKKFGGQGGGGGVSLLSSGTWLVTREDYYSYDCLGLLIVWL